MCSEAWNVYLPIQVAQITTRALQSLSKVDAVQRVGSKRDRGLPRNANATAHHRVILMLRFSDTIQLITVLLRQPTSTLSDEADRFQWPVWCLLLWLCQRDFRPKSRIRLSSSAALLILHNPICTYCCDPGYSHPVAGTVPTLLSMFLQAYFWQEDTSRATVESFLGPSSAAKRKQGGLEKKVRYQSNLSLLNSK